MTCFFSDIGSAMAIVNPPPDGVSKVVWYMNRCRYVVNTLSLDSVHVDSVGLCDCASEVAI